MHKTQKARLPIRPRHLHDHPCLRPNTPQPTQTPRPPLAIHKIGKKKKRGMAVGRPIAHGASACSSDSCSFSGRPLPDDETRYAEGSACSCCRCRCRCAAAASASAATMLLSSNCSARRRRRAAGAGAAAAGPLAGKAGAGGPAAALGAAGKAGGVAAAAAGAGGPAAAAAGAGAAPTAGAVPATGAAAAPAPSTASVGGGTGLGFHSSTSSGVLPEGAVVLIVVGMIGLVQSVGQPVSWSVGSQFVD